MQNDEGRVVDLYIPRKWLVLIFILLILLIFIWWCINSSWTNRLLAANDFGSVQVCLLIFLNGDILISFTFFVIIDQCS